MKPLRPGEHLTKPAEYRTIYLYGEKQIVKEKDGVRKSKKQNRKGGKSTLDDCLVSIFRLRRVERAL